MTEKYVEIHDELNDIWRKIESMKVWHPKDDTLTALMWMLEKDVENVQDFLLTYRIKEEDI